MVIWGREKVGQGRMVEGYRVGWGYLSKLEYYYMRNHKDVLKKWWGVMTS